MPEDLAKKLKDAQQQVSYAISARAGVAGTLAELRSQRQQLDGLISDHERRLELAESRVTGSKERLRQVEQETTKEAQLAAARKRRAEAMATVQQQAADAEAALEAAKQAAILAQEKLALVMTGEGQ